MPDFKSHRLFAAVGLIVCFSLPLIGCARPTKTGKQTVLVRVRSEVATILKKSPEQIDAAKPLSAQGADDLDIVEIVMAVEDAFKVELPDSDLAAKGSEITKTLTVQKLADVVTTKMRAK